MNEKMYMRDPQNNTLAIIANLGVLEVMNHQYWISSNFLHARLVFLVSDSDLRKVQHQHPDSMKGYCELVCQEGLTDQNAILVRKSLWFTKLTFKFH